MVQRTVLKVDISCQKCKKKLLKAVSGLEGVEKVEVDVAKGTLTVTGDADPYEVIVRTRKAGKFVEVVSVGPPPAPPKKDGKKKADEKKDDEKKPEPKPEIPMPCYTYPICEPVPCYTYPICEPVGFVRVDRWDEPNASCSVM